MRGNKAKQGCWTCKKRKIGCDKQVPECNNCLRTSRKCLGYGVRLVWPDRYDGRRKDLDFAVCDPTQYLPVVDPHYGKHFLNVDFGDLVLARDGITERGLAARSAIGPSRGLPPPHPAMANQDASCIIYYEQQISPMISTLHTRNGFRTALLPMAMSGFDASASALCQAMMAVSAYHRFGPEGALRYKTNAVRSLRDSLGSSGVDGEIWPTETQVAASMMLCVYNVFDETEGNWHIHLDGAKWMLQRLPLSSGLRKSPASAFLLTWFLYHEILGGFTQPLRRESCDSGFMRELLDLGSPTSYIVGSLGCSIDILAIIHDINQMRPLVRGDGARHSSRRLELEVRLQNLAQLMAPDEEDSESALRRHAILATAELYRLATILYLLRVCPTEGDELACRAYVKQAFQVLSELEVATSPWPLFVIACESETDKQRVAILHTLAKMEDVRKIGNIYTMRNMIETFWKNRDLNFDASASAHHRGDWLSLVNLDTAVPWFI